MYNKVDPSPIYSNIYNCACQGETEIEVLNQGDHQ